MMKLFDYFRSSAAYRVRIVLNLKGIAYEHAGINLLKVEDGADDYRAINPQGLVPSLQDGSHSLFQSLAICEYLEEIHPTPTLLPGTALERARIRALAQMVACDIHPVNNLRILKYLTSELGVTEEQKLTWYQHWINEGFQALESLLASSTETGQYCHGDTVTLADVCLVPQVYNARRFKLDLTPFPTIQRIEQQCLEQDAFERAQPENQPDAI
ncbi:MAG: maleylacetoacetate isomerase [Sedimenticola sp.]|nr:maleylacetoacetate isomerase [Sedimenticola sp.]